MKQFEVKSEHDPETWLKLWDRRVVVLSSANKSAYGGEKCFFGTHKGEKLMVYYHKDYDNPYLVTRFMGTIEADGSGSRITGVIGKMKSAVIFLWFMFFAMGIGGIVLVMQQQYQQSLPLFVLSLIGLACVLVTPADSAARLEKLLKAISVDEYVEGETSEEEPSEEEPEVME